ncbi:MAG: hypothetical protein JSW61_12195 [Candidatus Thorarchaeota archaeon]|nr:MAG: hypothetical protein JSW61_12195 [Candidatus Thorarchaeota archaeon]
MKPITDLSRRIFNIARRIEQGELNPLDVKLTPAFRELKIAAGQVHTKIEVDELLNGILSAKVNRVQELVRVIGAPERYVEKLSQTSSRKLSKMIRYRQPLVLKGLSQKSLDDSLARMLSFIDAISREGPEDQIPSISFSARDIILRSEDVAFSKEMEDFITSIPVDKKIPLVKILTTDSKELRLRRFLYVILMVSDGTAIYDPQAKDIVRLGKEALHNE